MNGGLTDSEITITRRSVARVLVAGGGPAAIEAALALRTLAREGVAVELITPEDEFVYRPLAVSAPFSDGRQWQFPMTSIASACGARLRHDAVDAVDVERRTVALASGEFTGYDALLLAIGARPIEAIAGVTTFWGAHGDAEFTRVLERLRSGGGELVFVVPHRVRWTLPLYELALLSVADLRESGSTVEVSFVTPEPEPLAVFGGEVSAELAEEFANAGIELKLSADPMQVAGPAELPGGERAVVALPRWVGPRLAGLPADDEGFLAVDDFGRVLGAPRVYAAGDVADYHVKQGGIATEQADAAASAIAADLGFPVKARPADRVLRARMLKQGKPWFMSRDLDEARSQGPRIAAAPSWWPAAKIFGRHLAPFLAALARVEENAAQKTIRTTIPK